MVMTYDQFCSEFISRVISIKGREIACDAKIVREMVDQYPNFAEKWFFDLPRTEDKQTVEYLFPLLAMVAAILAENHGITGPSKCFKK